MIQEKLKAFAHAEYNSDYYTNLERIKTIIDQQKDLFNRNQEYIKINLDDTFPRYITQKKEDLKEWII